MDLLKPESVPAGRTGLRGTRNLHCYRQDMAKGAPRSVPDEQWEMYLKKNGFRKFLLPESCPECVTVREFAMRFPEGTYVIGTGSHAVCVIDSNWYDTWDSGDETPTYFFRRSE